MDYLDTTIRDDDDLQAATGLPNLAIIPRAIAAEHGDEGHIVARDAPQSLAAEAYRNLRTALQFMSLDRPIHTVLVTSARPGEGKTTTATNLAIVASRSGQRVMLIDCDLRKPQAHLFFELPNEVGFTSVLLGQVNLQQAAQFPKGDGKLAIVTSGPLPPDPSDLLSGETARKTLSQLGGHIDLIVIDSPPVLPVADPTVLAGMVDGVIVVAAAGSTDRRQLARAVNRLQAVEAPILGTVLNRYEVKGEADYSYGYDRPSSPRPAPTDDTDSDATPSTSTIRSPSRRPPHVEATRTEWTACRRSCLASVTRRWWPTSTPNWWCWCPRPARHTCSTRACRWCSTRATASPPPQHVIAEVAEATGETTAQVASWLQNCLNQLAELQVLDQPN